MASTRYGVYPVILDAVTISQVSAWSVNPAVQKLVAIPGGALDPGLIGIASAMPTVNFRSADLKTVLDAISPSAGLSVAAATFQLQKRACGGSFTSGSTHVSVTSTGGFAKPDSISASEGSLVEIACSYYAHFDGTNAPLVVNDSQALSGSPAHNQSYAMGPVGLNGSQIEGLVGVSINFGIDYRTVLTDGLLYPNCGSIYARQPTVDLTFISQNTAATYGLFGYALPGSLIVYFQKLANGGRVAKATAGHVAMTFSSGVLEATQLGAANQENGNVTYRISGISAISKNTGSAIPF